MNSLLVIIPTYNRLESLYWVLNSLMNCELPQLNEKPRIALVNNYPPNKGENEKVKLKIDTVHPNARNWEWIFLNREISLPPIENWYGAINSLAKDNDVVFLHGDDDIFIRSAIKERFEAIIKYNADILISEYYGGLTFYNDSCHLSKLLQDKDYKATFTFSPESWYTSPFISAVVFRYNELFKKSLEKSYNWINTQLWAPFEITSLMLPYYLPIACNLSNGKILHTEKEYIIRGTSLDDRINSPFGIPGWNSGFISIYTYDILNNSNLANIKELNKHRYSTLNFINSWYLTFYFDKRISKDIRKTTFKKIPFKRNLWLILKSAKKVLADRFNLTAISIRRQIKNRKNLKLIDDLLSEI